MILYQSQPKKRTRISSYTENRWRTIDGYIYEANKLAKCLGAANDSYRYCVSVNIMQDISPDDMSKQWSKITESLTRKGVVACWVIEASKRSNRFNYHLVIKSDTPNIKALIKAAATVRTNIKVEEYKPKIGWLWLRYMTKAKTAKYSKATGQLITRDCWKNKRVIFADGIKQRKYNFINRKAFLNNIKLSTIWKGIVKREKAIRLTLAQNNWLEDYANEIYDLTSGYYPIKTVLRTVAITYLDTPKFFASWSRFTT